MKRFTTLLFLSIFFLLGCSRSADTSQPPQIFYGEEVCTECGMIITEPRFAAAYYTVEGNAKSFDDIGGLCTHLIDTGDEAASFWVHDYDTEAWLKAEDAFFVMGNDIYTPMAFGVVAFSTLEQAKTLAGDKSGMVMSFDEVMAHYEMEEMEHEH